MTSTLRPPAPAPAPTPHRPLPWPAALASGGAVLLAGAPVTAVVQGASWFAHATVVVALVVAVGLLLHRFGPAAVVAGQLGSIVLLLTLVFTEAGLPSPAAVREFGALIAGVGGQIDTGVPPVAATPEILFLVTASFGLLAVAVHGTAVLAAAPAAAGVPLLAVFAVPAALADDLLPWWAMASAAAGFGLLLVTRDGTRSTAAPAALGERMPGGAGLVAGAVLLALGVGAGTGFVGTAGRFESGSGAGGGGGSIGLAPFTSLRGQLDESSPVELFRVRGLDRPTYLRALTLRDYVAATGWVASKPQPGAALPGTIEPEVGTPGPLVDVEIENIGFRDYWLPLYGVPLDVSGVPESQWVYDPYSGTGYTARPREDASWQQRTVLPEPSVEQLRAADGTAGVGPEYLNTSEVDPRVADIAREVVAGADTGFDRAVALEEYFTGSTSPFRYSLQTASAGGDDALVEFLTVGRVGYCEQYASAMAVMLRSVGVPARVAVGFTAGSDVGEYRSITTQDAHAWVEAWFPGVGWTTFDPTPLTDGRAITPPYVLDARNGAADGNPDLSEDERLGAAGAAAEQAPQAEAPQLAAPNLVTPSGDQGSGLLLWPFVAALVVAAGALLPAALRARERRRRLAAVQAGGPDAAHSGWSEVLAESVDRGVPTVPSDTVRGAARRLVREHHLDAEAQEALRSVVSAVEASWYGGGDPSAGDLAGPVRTVRAGIVSGTDLPVRRRLLPPSVVQRWRQRAGAAGHSPAETDHEHAAAPRI